MVEARTGRWRKIKVIVLVLVLLAGVGAFGGWYKFFREEPQPEWITADPHMRFKYGSIGAEHDAGVPYWIWYVLPRMFPEKLPGPGGYASLGVWWEEGQELPIGFTKKVIGFPSRRQYLCLLPYRELPLQGWRKSNFHTDRPQPYIEPRSFLSFHDRLRERSTFQPR